MSEEGAFLEIRKSMVPEQQGQNEGMEMSGPQPQMKLRYKVKEKITAHDVRRPCFGFDALTLSLLWILHMTGVGRHLTCLTTTESCLMWLRRTEAGGIRIKCLGQILRGSG